SATSTPKKQKLALVQALDNILKGVLIYETVRFAGVALSPETLALRSQNPKGKDLIRLNRLLLEDAYPLEIAKSRFKRIATEFSLFEHPLSGTGKGRHSIFSIEMPDDASLYGYLSQYIGEPDEASPPGWTTVTPL